MSYAAQDHSGGLARMASTRTTGFYWSWFCRVRSPSRSRNISRALLFGYLGGSPVVGGCSIVWPFAAPTLIPVICERAEDRTTAAV